MPTFRVNATMYTDLYIDIEADNEEEAYEKAYLADGGEFVKHSISGDWKIHGDYITKV